MATKITKPITINGEGKTVIFDGFDFTEEGYIRVINAEELVITNCRIYNLSNDPDSTTSRGYWLKTLGDKETKISVTYCFFGTNNNTVYNMLELNTKLKNGSSFSNNYFVEDSCTHNHINLYGAAESATIDINNNVFELTGGVRIGIKQEPVCTINVKGNTVFKTTDDEWAGLICIQPYGRQTTSFANMTVNINNLTIPSKQVAYYYVGSNDTPLTDVELRGKVYINGVFTQLPYLEG